MIRGGLIGLGRMGLTHLAILNTHPSVRWAAVCDTTPFLVKSIVDRLGLSGFSDYRKMLDQSELDFVVVCTPTSKHGDAISDALSRGLHVFCEKPLTLSDEESARVAATAQSRGLVTQVGYVNRFNAVFATARDWLRAGYIGTPIYYKAEMFGRTVVRRTKAGWRSKRNEGGGCLYEFASHCVDLAHFFFGPPARVSGSTMASVFSEAVDDAVMSTFHHEGGLTGQVLVNWSDVSYRRPYNRIEVFGSRGRLVVDQQELRICLQERLDEAGLEKGWTIKYVTDLEEPVRFYLRGNEFTRQLDHFVDCVKLRAASQVSSFQHGAETDRTLSRIKSDAAILG